MATDYKDFIRTQRSQFASERRGLVAQQRDIEKKLAEIDRELAALDAYENAKRPAKAAPPKATKGPRKSAAKRTGGGRGRRDSKREPILRAIAENPDGLTRGELLQKLGVKGDKSGEMSVSNALTAMTKSNQIGRRDKKYVPAAA
jgi:hypothetical protein